MCVYMYMYMYTVYIYIYACMYIYAFIVTFNANSYYTIGVLYYNQTHTVTCIIIKLAS